MALKLVNNHYLEHSYLAIELAIIKFLDIGGAWPKGAIQSDMILLSCTALEGGTIVNKAMVAAVGMEGLTIKHEEPSTELSLVTEEITWDNVSMKDDADWDTFIAQETARAGERIKREVQDLIDRGIVDEHGNLLR